MIETHCRPRLRIRGIGVAALLAAAAGTATLAAALFPAPAAAQVDDAQPVNGERVSVFLDCASRFCDLNYFRTELPWVNWVRLPEGSDVHLIMTSQQTGAGGRAYQLDFIGYGDSGYEEQLVYQAPPTGTDRETLDAISQTIGIGLLHFSTTSGFVQSAEAFRDIKVALDAGGEPFDPVERMVTAEEVEDPWNFWVFRIGGSTEFSGEQTRRNQRVDGNFSASRVTGTWKMNFRGNINYNQREIDLRDGATFMDSRTDWGFSELIAYALADNWSVGLQGEVRRMVRFNQAFRAEMTPALEFSFFPYEEATRRALTLFYKIGRPTADTSRRHAGVRARRRVGSSRWNSSCRSGSSGATHPSA